MRGGLMVIGYWGMKKWRNGGMEEGRKGGREEGHSGKHGGAIFPETLRWVWGE